MSVVSVNTSNAAAKVILNTAFESGAVAWAAVALSSPIGALGGAIFGAVRYVSQLPLAFLSNKLLNADNPAADTAAKTLARALTFFGSFGVAWGVLAAAGFSLSFSHVIVITAVSIITSIILATFLDCLGMNVPGHRE